MKGADRVTVDAPRVRYLVISGAPAPEGLPSRDLHESGLPIRPSSWLSQRNRRLGHALVDGGALLFTHGSSLPVVVVRVWGHVDDPHVGRSQGDQRGDHECDAGAEQSSLGYALVFQILNLVLGVGFGVLFRSTPVAVVTYFVIPTAWSVLTGTVSALAATGRWLDPSTAWNRLAGGTMTATTWTQVATTAAVWIALPALAGGWHVLHRPVNA